MSGQVDSVFVLLPDDFKGTIFFNFEAKSKLAKEVIIVCDDAIVYVVVPEEVEAVDSDIRDAESSDVVVVGLVYFNLQPL